MSNRTESAKKLLITELSKKYESKIRKEKSMIQRELTYAESLDPVDIELQTNDHQLVRVELDDKTSALIPINKCYMDENGSWRKNEQVY